MSVQEIFTEVPDRSSNVSRTLPKGLLSEFFGKISEAYEKAGLEPKAAKAAGTRPGLVEGDIRFQVGLSEGETAPSFTEGWFIASRANGIDVVQGIIAAYDGSFVSSRSRGVVVSEEDVAREFMFTKGPNGSISWLNELIAQSQFEVVEAEPLLPHLHQGSRMVLPSIEHA